MQERFSPADNLYVCATCRREHTGNDEYIFIPIRFDDLAVADQSSPFEYSLRYILSCAASSVSSHGYRDFNAHNRVNSKITNHNSNYLLAFYLLN